LHSPFMDNRDHERYHPGSCQSRCQQHSSGHFGIESLSRRFAMPPQLSVQ
jgi:hypothetical protein